MITPERLTALLITAAMALTACGDDTSRAAGSDANFEHNSSDNVVVNGGAVNANGSFPDAGFDSGEAPDPMKDAGSPQSDAGSLDMDEPAPPVEVAWPASIDEFVATATDVSYVSSLALPATDPSGYPTCCRDFGEMSKRPGNDNALSSLMGQLISLDPDSGVETLLQDSVEQGSVVLLLDHRAFDGGDDADGYALSWIDGQWAPNTQWAAASDGAGVFGVSPDSFVPGSGKPRSVMNPALLDDGIVSAGPINLRLQIPVGFALVPITVHDARVEATIRSGDSGVGYSEGSLSGYAATSEVFEALNEIVGANCACLGLDDPYSLYEQSSSGNWSGACATMAHVTCPEPEQEVCRTLGGANVIDGGFCGVLPQILQNRADIDSDADGTWDSLSLGLEWTAVPASLE